MFAHIASFDGSMPSSLFSDPELVVGDRSLGLYDFETDVLAGSILYDTLRSDDSASSPVPTAAPEVVSPEFDTSLPTTEDIFNDLEALCALPPSDWPLVNLSGPFYPYDPTAAAETDEEEGPHITAANPYSLAITVYESDDSSSDGGSHPDSDYCDEAPLTTSTPRVISALADRASPGSFPAPQLRAAALSVDSIPATSRASKQRPPRRARVPAGAKRVAVSTSSSPGPVVVPGLLANVTYQGEDRHLPPFAECVPEKHWYLLRMGCIPLANGGMSCYKASSGCPNAITRNIADMRRHVLTHNRVETQLYCVGCPQTFSRQDGLKRHILLCGSTHTAARRCDSLVLFNEMEEIVALRDTLPHPSLSDKEVARFFKRLNKTLRLKFEAFVEENR
ncbi:hypothetical protein B0H16DRAFT_1733645 [Mycena metata]|uniref:C2H2-type domain-containing protein n=1 Tax=Mycena metata TaxID=1033252 RepID=A0AAD7HXP3_9AGAR|nr:hypothetical protein B0H16DRAFT_1733645 [Mycena metata]